MELKLRAPHRARHTVAQTPQHRLGVANAARAPMMPPIRASAAPSTSNNRRTCFGLKPSASKIPTSDARCSSPS